MAPVANATPLIALDAVVIDTETTGLDPSKARIVEIAALRLAVGRLESGNTFRRFVRPDESIPDAATRVHGIDDATVADAPRFSEVWPDFVEYVGDSVLIGHSIGFDLAVFKRECGRIGQVWRPAATLDTALLAQLAEPNLSEHSLDALAVWLNVEIVGRHSALGDAAATAKVFNALIPRLRARGVRTLGEAVTASRQLASVLEAQHRAGWAEPVTLQSDAAAAGQAPRIETFAYRHRVGDIMKSPAKFVEPATSIESALGLMARDRISSLFVASGGIASGSDDTGIVTERDVLRALSDHGQSALAMPVATFMSQPLVTVSADDLAYLAIGRMNRLKIRHLGVTSAFGEVVGALSARDLLKLRNQGSIELGDEIEQARDVHELALAWAKLSRVAGNLCQDGTSAREVAQVISHQLNEATRRAAVLAEESMRKDGFGGPPCRYALFVLGSAGRGESLLAMDQDNALVYEDGQASDVTAWFETLGVRVADTLHQVGVPYCIGGIMAKNERWRGSVTAWRSRVADWIRRSSPEDLLAVDIFFDLQGVHGDSGLADMLWREAFEAARGQSAFAKLLVEVAGPVPRSLTWLGAIRTERGRVDLKRAGLFAIVSAARSLAVCHHVLERSTPKRLAGIKALGFGMEADLDAIDEAHACFLDLILRQQIEDIGAGRAPSNAVEVARLSRRDRTRLRSALRAIENLDAISRDLLFRT